MELEKKEIRDRFWRGLYIVLKINGEITKISGQTGKLFIYS